MGRHTETFDILIDRKWHAGTFEVRSWGGADCDTYHYLIVAKLGERLSVSKQILYLEKIHPKKHIKYIGVYRKIIKK